jgi:O-antigen biosynthesis protein
LQHRGIHFIGADGIPTARNLGVADDALGEAAQHVGEAAGVTAACLLVRRAAFDAVGGYTPGYIYGTEDVDLNIKLRGNGGRLVYDGLAALWHHEYGTQNAEGQEWKRRNWARNRQLFVNRFGPQAFRTVLRTRPTSP